MAAAAVALWAVHAAPCASRAARICRGAGRSYRRAGGGLARSGVARERLRLRLVLPQVLARITRAAGAAALPRSQHESAGGAAREGRSHQHGAFARSATAAARPSAGRVHVGCRSAVARRSKRAPRQAFGARTHAAALAARSPRTPEERLWPAGAPLDPASPAGL